MKILWFTWKDREHPLAGGAEIVHDELAKRLVQDGHEVIFIVPKFKDALAEDTRHGYKVVRVGNAVTVYWEAYKLYKKEYKGWADIVVDSYFVLPFFTKFYVEEKKVLLVHNLCRQIWWYQMFFPGSLVGYLLEPLYLRLINDHKVITISESTKQDLLRHNFKSEHISIISEGIEIAHIEDLEQLQKNERPTILSLGAIRSMKRTDHIIKAFEQIQKEIPEAQLIVAGSATGKYGQRVLELIKNSSAAQYIEYLGSVSTDTKIELMRKAHLIAVTSIKEGWGLIVTEANSQGTPAVVYDVDGLRDSVQNGKTGLVCAENTPEHMAQNMTLLLKDSDRYSTMQKSGWEWSKELTFDRSYADFVRSIQSYA